MDSPSRRQQNWPWWPLLPLYPYGNRCTIRRALIPGHVWSFEQLQGIFHVVVPIRMVVVSVPGGLLAYAPVAPTRTCLALMRELEAIHGPLLAIVLPSSSGLEHKLPVPAFARAFPGAAVWVTPKQWSFPLNLPLRTLGFPASRTRVLFEQGLPFPTVLDWQRLGPIDIELGWFCEASCFHRPSGSLLVTDGLIALDDVLPELLNADPTAVLFHARESGREPLRDTPERRRRGWQRLLLLSLYLRPDCLELPPLSSCLGDALAPGLRNRRSYFGLYPFRWRDDWQDCVHRVVRGGTPQVAPILERLVFPRRRAAMAHWLAALADLPATQLVPCHFRAPVPLAKDSLRQVLENWCRGPRQDDASISGFLQRLDRTLVAAGLVSGEEDVLLGGRVVD